MARKTDKIPLIIAVFEQNICNSKRQLDFAVAEKDWLRAVVSQIRIDTANELLGVVTALGVKKETQSGITS